MAMIEFPSKDKSGLGYLAVPSDGSTGPGVVVIQEWWGLVDHIKDVCERFAAEGFVALAPDLYGGQTTTEPDEAGKQMMALDLSRAVRDMGGAVDYVRDRANGSGVGVIGFCMGGALAWAVACERPDAVKALVPFYGVIGWPSPQPDYSALTAKVQGHYAEHDDFASPEAVGSLVQRLQDLGKDIEVFTYPGTHHAFFNDTRPEVYDAEASALAWTRAVAFFRAHLA